MQRRDGSRWSAVSVFFWKTHRQPTDPPKKETFSPQRTSRNSRNRLELFHGRFVSTCRRTDPKIAPIRSGHDRNRAPEDGANKILQRERARRARRGLSKGSVSGSLASLPPASQQNNPRTGPTTNRRHPGSGSRCGGGTANGGGSWGRP